MDAPLSERLVGRTAAALFAVSGLVTAASLGLPAAPGVDARAVAAVGLAATAVGGVVWFLPWARWRRGASLWLVPVAFALIALHNHLGAADPYRYGLFFVVAFTWLGMAHPPGTSLRFAPLLAVAYLLPLWTGDRAAPWAVASVAYAVPICLLVGETLAWVAARLGRTRAELRRREADARFRALVQHVADLVAVADAGGVLTYASPAAERVLGYRPDELVGRPIDAIDDPDDAARTREIFADLARRPGATERFDLRVRHRDGSARRLEVVATNRLGDPSVDGIVVNARDVTERARAEAALREAEARYRTLVEQIPTVTYVEALDRDEADWTVRYVSPQIEALLGYTPAEWTGGGLALWNRVVHPDDRDRVVAEDHRTEATGEPFRVEYRLRHRDGRVVWVRDEALPVRDADGRPLFWQGIMLDVTERKAAEARLQTAEAKYRTLVEQLPAITYVQDAADPSRLLYVNPRVETLLGYAPDAWSTADHPWTEHLHPDDRERVLAEVARTDRSGEPFRAEYRERTRDGRYLWFRDEAVLVRDDAGAPLCWQGVKVEITERKALEEELAHRAFHDPLTGLPNRAHFDRHLARALARRPSGNAATAVLLLDLDRFKLVNDSLGHAAGDRLLVAVAGRLAAAVRPSDTLARFGGDEFAVLLERLSGPAEAEAVTDRLLAALGEPFLLDGREVVVTPSIGVAVGATAERSGDLLREADVALYRAKAAGRATAVVFAPHMDAEAAGRLELETDLRHALERDELRLHYQPIVDLATGRTVAVEALVRWAHPARGLLLPHAFLPVADEIGLSPAIGAWVLETACRQLHAWVAAANAPPGAVGVNLSARQLRDPGLVAAVAAVLAATGVPPAALRLEVSEQVLTEDLRAAAGTLRALRDRGVRLAIDDFGAGSSSLASLRELPADVLKLDRSFAGRIVEEGADRAIVKAMAALAHELGMRVTAEGIETAEQAAAALALGCDLGQGYHFAPPVPFEDLAALLRTTPRRNGRHRSSPSAAVPLASPT